MFEYCPKIERICAMCSKSDWNPMTDKRTGEPVLFCGAVTGYDTRVAPLPSCWLEMTKSMRTKYRKQKRAEYEALNPEKLDYKIIGTKKYNKNY